MNDIKNKIEKCKNTSLEDININDIDDYNDIKINEKKSSKERLLDFLNTTKNPYAFKSNGKIVKISYSESNLNAEDCLIKVIQSLYK